VGGGSCGVSSAGAPEAARATLSLRPSVVLVEEIEIWDEVGDDEELCDSVARADEGSFTRLVAEADEKLTAVVRVDEARGVAGPETTTASTAAGEDESSAVTAGGELNYFPMRGGVGVRGLIKGESDPGAEGDSITLVKDGRLVVAGEVEQIVRG
jgi:hypothetical protein